MHKNFELGGSEVKRSYKAKTIEMKKKAPSHKTVTCTIGNIASLSKDMILIFFLDENKTQPSYKMHLPYKSPSAANQSMATKLRD